MADVIVVKANIRPLNNCVTQRYKAGEAMALGQPVYISGNDTVSLTDSSAAATNFVIGVVVSASGGGSDAASGEWVDVAVYGPVTGYTTNMAAGILLYTDDDAGIISTTAGTKKSIIGYCKNATTLFVQPSLVDLA